MIQSSNYIVYYILLGIVPRKSYIAVNYDYITISYFVNYDYITISYFVNYDFNNNYITLIWLKFSELRLQEQQYNFNLAKVQ